RTPYTITEESVRSHLQVDDDGDVEDMPIADIYLGMDNHRYPTEGKLTFHKNKFLPKWRFLVHTILHCLSTKSGSWDQFGSPLAIALICLSDERRFNWLSYIFKGMVNNISNAKKFLLYPRSNLRSDEDLAHALSFLVSALVRKRAASELSFMFLGADIPPRPPLFLLRDEMQRKIQQDVLDLAKYYTDADWTDIMGQVHANQGLTFDLLGPDLNKDNFAERMVALIAERRRPFAAQRFQGKRNKPMTYAQQKAYMRTFVKNQSSTIYTTGWTMKHVKSLSDEQRKSEFEKIKTAVADLQSQNIRRTLKRAGADLEQDVSKKSKTTEVPMSSPPDVPQQPTAIVPPANPQQSSVSPSQSDTSGTRRKSLGTRRSTTALYLDADDRSFIRVLSDDDSDSDDDTIIVWFAFASWDVVSTPLDRQDLVKLYGMVVRYYEDHPLAGADGSYPLSAQLMKKMLRHKLEIPNDGVGNDMTHAEQPIRLELIEIWFQFLEVMKVAAFGVHAVNFLMMLQRLSPAIIIFLIQEVWSWFQDVAVQSSGIVTTSRYLVPTGRVKVPAGRYVVPTSKDNVIVSAGRSKVIPAGRTILVLQEKDKKRSKRKYYDSSYLFLLKNKLLFKERQKQELYCFSLFLRIIWLIFHHIDDAQGYLLAVKARFGSLGLLELDVKGGSSYGFKSLLSLAMWMENILHSFVAESDPQQQITYEDFDQIRKLDLEELDIKWQMAMLSVRINRFEKKAGRKMKFNNKDAARFDKEVIMKVKMWESGACSSIWDECWSRGGLLLSDKSSDSETTGFASCVSSVQTSSSKTNEPLASVPSSVAVQTLSKTADQQPSSTNDNSSFSFKENENKPSSVPAGKVSRNRPTSVPVGRPFSVGSPHKNRDLGIVDSGCSRSMTDNKEKLDDFEKIVGDGLVNGLPSKLFTNEHNCVACNKGKQHKASYKAITAVDEASDMVESSSDYAEELARLQKQAYKANATAEKHLGQADLVASRNKVPAGKIDSAAGVSYGPTETSTPVVKPVHTDAPSLPPEMEDMTPPSDTAFSLPLLCEDFEGNIIFPKHRSLETPLYLVQTKRYIEEGTDISQKDEKPSKKRQNRTRDGKVCEDEAQSKSSQSQKSST
ncbi:hypothetical protein Tco_0287448, partial [Tanacetum coccineum]